MNRIIKQVLLKLYIEPRWKQLLLKILIDYKIHFLKKGHFSFPLTNL